MVRGDTVSAVRRKAVLSWVDTVWREGQAQIGWTSRPEMVSGPHWQDLHAGASFFSVREAALLLLDKIEAHIGNLEDRKMALGTPVRPEFSAIAAYLKERASAFLEIGHDPTPDRQASTFCNECLDEKYLLERLVGRDGQVLRLSGQQIIPGPAFRGISEVIGDDESEDQDAIAPLQAADGVSLPPGVSQRVLNMFYLNIDLSGELTKWFSGGDDE